MTTLALTALLAGVLAAAPGLDLAPRAGTAALPTSAARADAVDELAAEYDQAVVDWRNALREAGDIDAKRAIRERHPAKTYYPRFQELYDSGELRAAVWMIVNARHTDRSRAEAADVALKLYVALFEGETKDGALLAEAAEQLVRDRRTVGEERAVALLTRAFERLEEPEDKARLGLLIAQLYGRMEGEENATRATEWYDRIAEAYPETEAGAAALDRIFVQKHLQVGSVAPDFGGQSVDGEELRLSDHRGKIVVVDFFGFW